MKLRHGRAHARQKIQRFAAMLSHPALRCASAAALVGLCVITWGCQTTPVSGRRQLVLIPEAKEMSLGATTYQDILAKETPSRRQQYVQMVERVGQRIAAVAGRDDFAWEFKVIESDQQNAFCLPGGKVAVYEGIIPICQSEAGLAVVMSHEIAHALARHGGERMTHQQVKQFGGKAVDFAGKWFYEDEYDSKREIVLTAYGVGSEYLGVLPYSRKHESEADLIGIELMAKAGYDPSEAPSFWERFAVAKGGKESVEFFSTHPSDVRRAADLRESLPKALEIYETAPQQYGLGERIATVDSTNLTLPLVSDTRRQ